MDDDCPILSPDAAISALKDFLTEAINPHVENSMSSRVSDFDDASTVSSEGSFVGEAPTAALVDDGTGGISCALNDVDLGGHPLIIRKHFTPANWIFFFW